MIELLAAQKYGVVPAWGGCKEMLRRWSEDSKSPKGPMGSIVKIFENLGTAKVASSAQEARDMKFLLDLLTDCFEKNINIDKII